MELEQQGILRSVASNHDTELMSKAIDQIGDRWTLLILNACIGGTSRFDGFQKELGIVRNILAQRLKLMVDEGLLSKKPVREGARRMGYELTPKGRALAPLFMHLGRWASEWAASDAEELEEMEPQRSAGLAG